MAGNKLIQTIQSMAKPPIGETTDLLFGEVMAVSPLKIRVDNRFEVDEQFLILSALVKETIIHISTAETPPPSQAITLWRGLIVGDKVRLLRVNNGQMFYIIEREGGVI